MPEYPYECVECGHTEFVKRRMVERDMCPSCAMCGGRTERRICAQIQLNTQPMAFSDLWRPRKSAKETLREQIEGEKRYNKTMDAPTLTPEERKERFLWERKKVLSQ